MKAVVVDITDGEATIMTQAGDITAIRDKGYEVGQEINVRDGAGSASVRVYRFAAVAAAAAAAVLVITGIRLYFSPYGTVSLDVNPSIEYTINRFDRVIRVNGVNDDGSDILSGLDMEGLVNRDIEDALDVTIEQIEAEGYITDESGNYVVVSANTEEEDHTDRLIEKLDRRVRGHKNMEPVSFKVTDDELDEAHRQGISGGKKKMIDSLEGVSDEAIDREEWKGRSVKDIVKERERLKNHPRKTDEKTDEDGSEQMPDDVMPEEPPRDDNGSDAGEDERPTEDLPAGNEDHGAENDNVSRPERMEPGNGGVEKPGEEKEDPTDEIKESRPEKPDQKIQPDKPVNEPLNEPMIESVNEQPDEQPDRIPDEQPDKKPDIQPDRTDNEQPGKVPGGQIAGPSDEHPDEIPGSQPAGPTDERPDELINDQPDRISNDQPEEMNDIRPENPENRRLEPVGNDAPPDNPGRR